MKVAIIGGGGVVGSTAAYRIAQDGIASEIILVDARPNMAQAHALDIEQAIVRRAPTRVRAGRREDTKDSDVIIVAVGAVARPSEIQEASFLEENMGDDGSGGTALVLSPRALWMIATIPVDTFVYLIHHRFSIPRKKVIGVNGNDTSRFRWAVAKTLSVPAHGGRSLCAWRAWRNSSACVQPGPGKSRSPFPLNSDQQETDTDEPSPIGFRTGSGWSREDQPVGQRLNASAMSWSAWPLNDDRVWACSTPLDGEYGYRDVAFGVPVRMGPEGVKEVVEFDLVLGKNARPLSISAEAIREQIRRGRVLLERKNPFSAPP